MILAADTATGVNTVSLLGGKQVLAETVVFCPRAHSERFVDTVDWVLTQAGKTLGDVDLLAVSAGPGSFTGLRVGVAAMKGLAAGAGLPLAGVSTLDAMAHLVPGYTGALCCMLDAKMGEVFAAAYRCECGTPEKVLADSVGLAGDFAARVESPVLYMGDGAETYWEQIRQVSPGASLVVPALAGPRATGVALAALAIGDALDSEPALVSPVYLRRPQAERARGSRAK